MNEHIDVDLGGGRQRSVPVELPGNSRRLKAAKAAAQPQEAPREKQEKIISGDIVKRKKSLGKRFTESFFGEESVEEAVQGFVAEILVSAFKSMVSDTIGQFSNALRDGSDRFLYGQTRREAGSPRARYVSYNTMSGNKPAYHQMSERGRTVHDFDDLVLPSRGEAEDVLDRMRALVSQFEVASVADFYDLCGVTRTGFPDERYGWTDLRHATVRHIREGYLISMPRPQPID